MTKVLLTDYMGREVKQGSYAMYLDDTSRVLFVSPDGISFTALGRELLKANRNLYVTPTGNDTTGTGEVGSPWLTNQKAYDYITSTLDLGGYTVTVNTADGTYAPGSGVNVLLIAQPWTGGGSVFFEGNITTPANVVFSATSAAVVLVTCTLPGILRFRGMKITATGGRGLEHRGSGILQFGLVDFGACGGAHYAALTPGAFIGGISAYAISGNSAIHMQATFLGKVETVSITITLVGSPVLSTAFAFGSRNGVVQANNLVFSGAAGTGTKKYNADLGGGVFTNSGDINYFPGNVAGTADAATYGWYN